VVIGLGNPVAHYAGTRHNVGQWLVTSYAADWSDLVCNRGVLRQHLQYLCFCPDSFMNLSGHAIQACMIAYAITIDRILVVHDDLDFPINRDVLRKGSGHAGHRGVEHLMKILGTANFWRLRLGIGRPLQQDISDYVLSHFTLLEQQQLNHKLPMLHDTITQWLKTHHV
jgi:peptidyl-tRNA hydrolase, PTH1 family